MQVVLVAVSETLYLSQSIFVSNLLCLFECLLKSVLESVFLCVCVWGGGGVWCCLSLLLDEIENFIETLSITIIMCCAD